MENKNVKKVVNELAKKSVEKIEVKNDDVKNSEQVEVKDEVENSDIDLNKFSESEFKASINICFCKCIIKVYN